ncbi:helix-turn-helix domain-containing protein [Methylocella sp.]|uniref:helix-turn-helix domain-containing protein n=1 Tax=Methylocella sp. TaxID=1978226 RepID=UPI0037841EF2
MADKATANAVASSAEKLAYHMKEFCAALGISPSTAWAQVAAGKIATIRVGRRVLVPAAELQRILKEGC